MQTSVALNVQEKIKFHHDENISVKTAKEEMNAILTQMGIDPSKHIDLTKNERKFNQNIMNVFAGFTAALLTATVNNPALEQLLETMISSSIQTSSTHLVDQHSSSEQAEKIIQEGFKSLENELLVLVRQFGGVELSEIEYYTRSSDTRQNDVLESVSSIRKEVEGISQLSEQTLNEVNTGCSTSSNPGCWQKRRSVEFWQVLQ